MPYANTFLDAVHACHPDGKFMMSMPHNGQLTEAEYNGCYLEITGTTSDDTIITSANTEIFKVNYSTALTKYKEIK